MSCNVKRLSTKKFGYVSVNVILVFLFVFSASASDKQSNPVYKFACDAFKHQSFDPARIQPSQIRNLAPKAIWRMEQAGAIRRDYLKLPSGVELTFVYEMSERGKITLQGITVSALEKTAKPVTINVAGRQFEFGKSFESTSSLIAGAGKWGSAPRDTTIRGKKLEGLLWMQPANENGFLFIFYFLDAKLIAISLDGPDR